MQTLQELTELQPEIPEDAPILDRIKKVATAHLPKGWQDWKAVRFNGNELLSSELDPQILNKLRFALPTVGIARAFTPDATSLPERLYRDMKTKMLSWPFCVGLIIGPPVLAARVRGSAAQSEVVLEALSDMKPLLLSRKETSHQLASESSDACLHHLPVRLGPSGRVEWTD